MILTQDKKIVGPMCQMTYLRHCQGGILCNYTVGACLGIRRQDVVGELEAAELSWYGKTACSWAAGATITTTSSVPPPPYRVTLEGASLPVILRGAPPKLVSLHFPAKRDQDKDKK